MKGRREDDTRRTRNWHYGYNQQDQDQQPQNWQRNGRNTQNYNQNFRQNNNRFGPPRQKPEDKYLEGLKVLANPKNKQLYVQKRQDFNKQKAKNEDHRHPEQNPRGGRIYRQQYREPKEQLDKQMQQYQRGGFRKEQFQKPIKVQIHSDQQAEELDLVLRQNQAAKNKKPTTGKDLSSLSFSVDFPSFQDKYASKPAKDLQNSKRNPTIQKKQDVQQDYDIGKTIKKQNAVKQAQKMDDSWAIAQTDNQKQKAEQPNLSILKQLTEKLPQDNEGSVQTSFKLANYLEESMSKEPDVQAKDQTLDKIKVVTEFKQVQESFDQVQLLVKQLKQKKQVQRPKKKFQQPDFNHFVKQYKKGQSKNQPQVKVKQSLPTQAELLQKINSYEPQRTAKVFISFQVIQNILAFTIKDVELTKLGVSVKVDANGKAKFKQYQNLSQQILEKYIKFNKTSHLFPRMGIQKENQHHFADMLDAKTRILDQTNYVEFQLCQVKVNQNETQNLNQTSKNLLTFSIFSLLCMTCQTKNDVTIFPNDLTAVCSCRANSCSEKMEGKIKNIRMELC